MDHNDHVHLLRPANLKPGGTYADFGAGSGAFTLALRGLVGLDATIHAVDKDRSSLNQLDMLLAPMARECNEAVGSMGTDTPLAVLSNKPQPLFNYFKQLFAQVTNPPIDCIREEIITATETAIGSEHNLLKPGPQSCRLIELKSPILTNEEFAKLQHVQMAGFKPATVPILFKVADGPAGLEKAMAEICRQVSQAITGGANVVELSDRGLNAEWAPVPSLLAVSGVHHHLIREGTRTHGGLVLESGEPREVHHYSLLIGYGCGAINPYLVFETLDDMIRQGLLTGVDHKTACKNYLKAAIKGVVKVASKMGELLDDVVFDILYRDVTAHTISKAQQIASTADELDMDFVLVVAGGNPENLNALSKLALEELIRYLQGGDDDNDGS